MSGTGTLRVGTSGFAYDGWKNVFYPEGTRSDGMLAYYATRLNSVEINYSFRRLPSEKTLLNWREQVPEGFAFTLKASQRITHQLKLRDAGESVEVFMQRARLLGDRLGVVLFQCPPYLRHDRELLESFVAVLPADGRYAMEFRHASWDEARGSLAEKGIAWCAAETDDKGPGELGGDPFAFMRLRKTGYTDEEIDAWAARISELLRDGRDVFCYFKHEDEGAAPRFAERLVGAIAR